MGKRTQESGKARRRGVVRGVRVGVIVAALALLAAAPVLAVVFSTPTSSSNYVFATTSAQGAPGLWKNISQTVSITASPTANATVTEHFNSGNGTSWRTESAVDTHTATFAFGVSAEGANAIEFYATDSSSATESIHTPGFVNIDATAPTFTIVTGLETTTTQSADAQWSKVTTGTVTLAATDTVPPGVTATSGVKEILWSISGVSTPATQTASLSFAWAKGSGGVVEGSNPVVYSARDWAGNLVTRTGFINIDTVAPSTVTTPTLASSPTTGWRNTAPTVTLTGTDVSSGVPAGAIRYWVDADTPHIYTAAFTVGTATGNQSYAVHYFSTDRAGNVEATQTAYVNIDTTSPTVRATTAPVRRLGWYNKDVVVTIKGDDLLSGVAKTQYRLQGASAWTDAAGNQFTVPVSPAAKLTYEYQATDNAGNVSAVGSLHLNMDAVHPTTHGAYASGKVHKAISVRFKIKDNLSPSAQGVQIKIRNAKGKIVKKLTFSGTKKMGTWYTYKWTPTTRGTYKYYVYAKDLASNSQLKAGYATIRVK